jgi:hypothetical protein
VAFTNRVRDAIEARKAASRRPPSAAEQGDDVIAKLERLAALLEKGVITQDEFAQQKKKLLA